MRIGRDELRLASLEELQFGGWKLHVAFATPTKLRERLCYQPPLKEYWLHGWKTQIHTVVQFELAFLAQLLGAPFILPGEVCP